MKYFLKSSSTIRKNILSAEGVTHVSIFRGPGQVNVPGNHQQDIGIGVEVEELVIACNIIIRNDVI